MSDDDDEREDTSEFDAWLKRGIADGNLASTPRFRGASVPDRDPAGDNPWRPRGPINVGGRVRALALDPELLNGAPRAVYAGAASGGVFRTRDGGRRWESIWKASMPAHAIGAIAAGAMPAGKPRPGDRWIWVATGEKSKLPGAGVWRAIVPAHADGPLDWVQAGTLEQMTGVASPAADALPSYLEAAAVDPDDPRTCWFVGPKGIYRCVEDPIGTFAWSAFAIDTTVSGRRSPGCADVEFVSSSNGRYVVLAPLDTAWGDLILIPNPERPAAAITAALRLAANTSRPLGPAVATLPALRAVNARLAILPGTSPAPDRVYAIYANGDAATDHTQLHALVVGDMIAAAGAPAAPAWVTPAAWTQRAVAAIPQVERQQQGDYALCLAAASGAGAGGADLVAFGMLDVYVSLDGGATFTMSLDWTRYDLGDVGQHADQHALAIAPTGVAAAPLAIWVGNDGGVARSDGFRAGATVRAPEVAGWRRSVNGLVIGQTYDLSQSPALPDACGVALQDLGGWIDGGGGAWRHIEGGDGLSVEFDPVDPHHVVATWQGGDGHLRAVDDIRFEGDMNFGLGGDGSGRRALFRGLVPGRRLVRGIVPGDRGAFEDTILHPTRPGSILHIRARRLYTSRDGETFALALLGDRVELMARLAVDTLPAAPGAPPPAPQVLAGVMLRVRGDLAVALGFMPGETSELRSTAGQPPTPREYIARAVNGIGGPFSGGGTLVVEVEVITGSVTTASRFTWTKTIALPNASYTYADLLAALRTQLVGRLGGAVWTPIGGGAPVALPAGVAVDVYALPAFTDSGNCVEIVSQDAGLDVELAVGPAAHGAGPSLLAQNRVYRGARDRPAVVTLWSPSTDDPGAAAAAGETINVAPQRHAAGAAAPPVPLGDPLGYTWASAESFYRNARPASLLLAAARAGLRDARVRVWYTTVTKWVRLRAGRLGAAGTTPFTLVAASTALPGLTAGGAPASLVDQVLVDLKPQKRGRYQLGPAGGAATARLSITIGGATRDIDFAAADLGAIDSLSVEEVRRVIDERLNHDATDPATDIAVEVQRQVSVESPYEVAFSPVDPDVIWVGALNHLWVSTDAGRTWTERFPQPDGGDSNWNNYLSVEAIAPDPFPPADPDKPEYTALVGVRGNGWVPIFRVSTTADTAEVRGLNVPATYAAPSANTPIRVFALEADPARAGHYWAGTELGVYRSTDRGGSWSAMSVGLPHVPVLDLALDRATDTLRAAVFGHGVYERPLGDGAPRLPALHLRASTRDGGRRPVAHGTELVGDAPVDVTAVSSPDVIVSTMPAASVARLDDLELDDVPSEPARRGATHQVIVRAWNRGPTRIDDARVVVLWADAWTALPPLPDTFFDALPAPPVAPGAQPAAPAALPVGQGSWRLVGDARDLALEPGCARAVAFAWDTSTADHALAAVSRVAMLALVFRVGEPIARAEVTQLVLHDPRAAVRLVDVLPVDAGAVLLQVVAPDTRVPLGALTPGPMISAFAETGPTASQLTLAPVGAAVPPAAVVRSTHAPPWNVGGLRLDLSIATSFLVPQPAHAPELGLQPVAAPALASTTDGDSIMFDHAAFRDPTQVTAAEMRAYLGRRLARMSRLVRVGAEEVDLAIRRSPGDDGARVGGLAWQSAELIAVEPTVTVAAEHFALLALTRLADVAVGAPQRFATRVRNRGTVVAADAVVRFAWLDPRDATPTEHVLGTTTVTIAPGVTTIATLDATITGAGPDVVLLVDVDHGRDPTPARTFGDWAAVLAWSTAGNNTAARLLRRR